MLQAGRHYLKKQGRYVRSKGKKIPYVATTGCSGGSWKGRFTGTYTTALPVDPSSGAFATIGGIVPAGETLIELIPDGDDMEVNERR